MIAKTLICILMLISITASTKLKLNAQTLQGTFDLLKVAKGPFGDYLTDNSGISVYLFEKDQQGKSTCYQDCAVVWGPLLQPRLGNNVGEGVNKSLLGTSQREGGT